MNFDGMVKLLALNIDNTSGKRLFGSLINDGSLVVIGAIAGLAILAAVIIFLRKKKNKDENENE
ncbi:MAG: LPXTG cell wall anchor domain-containing protein [Clostridia bacterium]|nr:LPXTG cell wall anchor domain-containing protein [Clostridia bacterium]